MSTAVLPPTRDWFALPLGARAGWVVPLGSTTALHALTLDLYLPAFPQLRTDLGTSARLVRLTLTGTLVGLALGQLLVGPLSDALGRRVPLLAGLVLHVVASLGCALAPSIEVLQALRVAQGLGAAAAAVTALAVARDLFEGAGASRLIGRLVLVVGLSPVLATTLGGQLVQFVDWRGIFAVLAAAAALLTVVVQLVSRVAPQRLVLLGLVGALVASSALAVHVTVGSEVVDVVGAVALMCAVMLCVGTAVPGAPAPTLGRSGWAVGSAAALLGGAQFGIGASVLPLAATAGLRADLTMALAMTAGSALALAVLVAVVLPALRREGSAGSGDPPRPGARTRTAHDVRTADGPS